VVTREQAKRELAEMRADAQWELAELEQRRQMNRALGVRTTRIGIIGVVLSIVVWLAIVWAWTVLR